MTTGTIEEKIIQRQLSKEGLQNIVDDTDQVINMHTYYHDQDFLLIVCLLTAPNATNVFA